MKSNNKQYRCHLHWLVLPVLMLLFASQLDWRDDVESVSWAPIRVLETEEVDLPEKFTNVSTVEIEQIESTIVKHYLRHSGYANDVKLAWLIEHYFDTTEVTAQLFSKWIDQASKDAGIDPALLASVVATESTFREHVVSKSGAVGPAQIIPKYWTDFCAPLNLYDSEENIACSAQILAHLLESCGDEVCAIRSYNIGYPSVMLGKNPPKVVVYLERVETFKELFVKVLGSKFASNHPVQTVLEGQS